MILLESITRRCQFKFLRSLSGIKSNGDNCYPLYSRIGPLISSNLDGFRHYTPNSYIKREGLLLCRSLKHLSLKEFLRRTFLLSPWLSKSGDWRRVTDKLEPFNDFKRLGFKGVGILPFYYTFIITERIKVES